jgi:hypothetical protein
MVGISCNLAARIDFSTGTLLVGFPPRQTGPEAISNSSMCAGWSRPLLQRDRDPASAQIIADRLKRHLSAGYGCQANQVR